VRERILASARLVCVRCLGEFLLPMDVAFDTFAERSGTGNRRDEIELERDDYMLFHDGRSLDLSDPVREALLLELPIAPRCRDDCKGLCPRCGGDRNTDACACDAPPA